MSYLIKVIISSILIVLISELSKKSSLVGGILASIPLISVLAIIWLYIDTQDIQKISSLSNTIFWLVIPSLVLFITLPIFLKMQINFYGSMFLSIVLTVIAYYVMIFVLGKFGVKI